jgi:UDP-N-acetylmuramoyl-L-alanyl-D-glutamate--2,6-diaminopimelate ligase
MNACAVTSPSTEPTINLAPLLADRLEIAPLPVRALTMDSRAVRPGDAFVALPGRSGHGLEHAAAAIAAGAIAVLFDAGSPNRFEAKPPTRSLAVPGLDRDFAQLADRAYREPSALAKVIGVTGTNGKTTTAWLVASAFATRGEAGGYIGTVGRGVLPFLAPSTHTTPDVFSLQSSLRELVDAGARHVALEVSSQGLDQGRIDGVRVYAAGFTNLTRDHLDYHGTMEAYRAAKARLFAARDLRHAVINVRDAAGATFASGLGPGIELTTIGARPVEGGRYVLALNVEPEISGLVVRGESHEGPFCLRSALVGDFNAENLMVALGLLLTAGMTQDEAVAALAGVTAPPGRMEMWRLPTGGIAVVDYAHTPDALEHALRSLRRHCRGTLWCVFGCGGDRDRGKRPAMGAAAERLADRTVLTDDNPRSEDSAAIIAEIATGMSNPGRVVREADRRAAIALACAAAVPGDIVLVAGMGHEEGQTYGAVRRPYSDRATVAELAGKAP